MVNSRIINCLVFTLIFSIFLAVFFLFYSFTFFDGYNNKRQLQVLIVIFSQFLLLYPPFFSQYFSVIFSIPLINQLVLLFFVLSGAVSISFGDHFLYAWGDWLHYLLLINMVVVWVAVFKFWSRLKLILLMVLLAGFCFLIIDFLVACIISLLFDGFLTAHLVYPSFGNIRFVNQIHVQLIFVVIALSLVFPKSFQKWFSCIVGLTVFMLLVGGARGAILAISFVVVFIRFIPNQSLKRLSINLLKAFFLGAAFYLVYIIYEYSAQQESVSSGLFRSGSSGRLSIWSEVVSGIVRNPFGIGSFHYGSFTNVFPHSHPHNIWLQFFIEWGWIAGVSFLFLLSSFLICLVKKIKVESDFIKLAIGCSILSGLLYSMLSGVFVMPASQVVFVFLLALFFSDSNYMEKNAYSKIERVPFCVCGFKKISFGLLMSVLLISYVVYVLDSYKRYLLYEDKSPFVKSFTAGPRMWGGSGIIEKLE